MQPIMKFAGGKRASADAICDALLEDTSPLSTGRYFEPFVGSGAVFLRLRERGFTGLAILGDTNLRLIQTWLAIRFDADQVIAALDKLPWDADWREHYTRIRDEFNAIPKLVLEPKEMIERLQREIHPQVAAMFLWLNRHDFNGLYRENLKGDFNVPIGSYAKPPARPTDAALRELSAALQNTRIFYGDFRTLETFVRPGDLVYTDPPYVPLSKTSSFTAYSGKFGTLEQVELAELAIRLGKRGARVVLSNHDTPAVREELYSVEKGFVHLASLAVKRGINSKATKRGAVAELLAVVPASATPVAS